RKAADDLDVPLDLLLDRVDLFVHETTHAVNAILTGATAKVAFLTTQGHPDILLFREGGRREPFDSRSAYPEPYVPRSLTFEVVERIAASGELLLPLDEESLLETLVKLQRERVEAVAVCLLWSVVNPVHEVRIAQLLDEHLPTVPYTLSHK